MAKITKTKFDRLFEVDQPGKITTGKFGVPKYTAPTYKRKEKPDPPMERFEKPCAACHLPMLVALGQEANYHGACRVNRQRHHARNNRRRKGGDN